MLGEKMIVEEKCGIADLGDLISEKFLLNSARNFLPRLRFNFSGENCAIEVKIIIESQVCCRGLYLVLDCSAQY